MKQIETSHVESPVAINVRTGKQRMCEESVDMRTLVPGTETLPGWTFGFLAFLLFVFTCPVWAQNAPDDQPEFVIDPEGVHGYQENGIDLSEYENVNLANGNLTLNIPLATLSTDGGLSYTIGAYYIPSRKDRGPDGNRLAAVHLRPIGAVNPFSRRSR